MFDNDLIEISGQVVDIKYYNEINGYCICNIFVQSPDEDIITIVGTMPEICEGENIRILGKWTTHPNFGRQFNVEYFENTLPSESAAILQYLSSRTIKGIGPATAQKIVAAFGEESFDVIENHPDWLVDIQGISAKKAKEISESFKSQHGMKNLMMLCQNSIAPAITYSVYKKWGNDSCDIIKANPYVIYTQMAGVSFDSVDKLAASMGFTSDCNQRLRAGIIYVLRMGSGNYGHSYLPYDLLIEKASKLLQADVENICYCYNELISERDIVEVKTDQNRCCYLKENYDSEQYCAMKLMLLKNISDKIRESDCERFISQLENEIDIKYAVLQRRAIINAVNSGVAILTGGPGTGKTTVIRAVIAVFERIGLKIALAAPTGRAAKRMSAATSKEAKTIHRLLEMSFDDNKRQTFGKNEKQLLEYDVVIIDEASMIDLGIFNALLHAVRPGCKLILIGDCDQLPPVGCGNILGDLIASNKFSTIALKEIFRQAKESLIVTNAHDVNNGIMPVLDVKDRDFFYISRDKDEDIAKTVIDLYHRRLPKSYGDDVIKKIQIITPSHSGPSGTRYINKLIQEQINPPMRGISEKKLRDVVLREGDKVMQNKNNYDIPWELNGDEGTGIYNGDIGTIYEINRISEQITVDFDGKMAVYDFSNLDELEHAWAITVHKSQGSEYPIVIVPLSSVSPKLLTRNLLYTAITRAVSMVILVGNKRTIDTMVQNKMQQTRYTGLEYFIRNQ